MSELSSGFVGQLIRQQRLKKDWSQQGLCQGICAVSYLSKIEQGKAQPSGEIAALLLDRLGVQWHTGALAQKAAVLAQRLFDAFCAMDRNEAEVLCAELDNNLNYVNTPSILDLLLLRGMYRRGAGSEADAFADAMNERQRCLLHLLHDEYEQAYRCFPMPITCALAGYQNYAQGEYALAQQRLTRAFQQAADACLPHLMLFCKSFLGNCCSDLGQYDAMIAHYEGAQRLAVALGNENDLRDIRYNIAATAMQMGRFDEAYAYYATLSDPAVMDLHKLAICCEALGRREEAMAALERAKTAVPRYQVLQEQPAQQMCDLVRYRLKHPDYLQDEVYGRMLMDCFEMLRRELPVGYARFHLPWMEEWYVAHRQYKQVWELSREFPAVGK